MGMNADATSKKLSKEALYHLTIWSRIARRDSESHRCFSARHRVVMNLKRAGYADGYPGGVRLNDAGLELALSMKSVPFERYERKRPEHRPYK